MGKRRSAGQWCLELQLRAAVTDGLSDQKMTESETVHAHEITREHVKEFESVSEHLRACDDMSSVFNVLFGVASEISTTTRTEFDLSGDVVTIKSLTELKLFQCVLEHSE